MPDENEFDAALDRALARYSDAEPLAGLEERVLRRVREGRRRYMSNWLAAFSLATALLVLWVALPLRQEPHTLRHQAETSKPTALPSARPGQFISFNLKPRRLSNGRGIVSHLPKQQDFPARTPASAEEIALTAMKAFPDFKAAAKPIEVEFVEIHPVSVNEINNP